MILRISLPKPALTAKFLASLLLIIGFAAVPAAADTTDASGSNTVVEIVSPTRGTIASEEIEITADSRPASKVTVLVDGDVTRQVGNPPPVADCGREKYERVGGTVSLSGNCVGAPFNC